MDYKYYNFEFFFDRDISTNIKYKFGMVNITAMFGYSMPSTGVDRIETGLTIGINYEKN